MSAGFLRRFSDQVFVAVCSKCSSFLAFECFFWLFLVICGACVGYCQLVWLGLGSFAFAKAMGPWCKVWMMLAQFSWQQFFVACGGACLLWYLFVWFWFFRNGGAVGSIGSGSSGGWSGVPDVGGSGRAGAAGLDVGDLGVEVMGKAVLPEGMSVVGSGELVFAGSGSSSGSVDRYGQVGLVADVLEELKHVFAHLVSSGGGKEEFLSMLALVKQRYPGIGAHPSAGALTRSVVERVSFGFSEAELDMLWV